MAGLIPVRDARAGQGVPAAAAPPFAIDGPPPPIAPDVIARNGAKATIRAVRLTAPLKVDGALDEAVYQTVTPISDFIQVEPKVGTPATEKTDVWFLFDNDNIYIAARCWETQPARILANDMRRDNGVMFTGNDNIAFILDTFYDRRSGLAFVINPIGGRNDGQVVNEKTNLDFNPIYDAQTGKFPGGWTVEVAIPFKSLPYRPGRAQIWGFNINRRNMWKNEVSTLIQTPANRGSVGITMTSLTAAVVGIEAPTGLKNLEIKPYAIASLATDVTARPPISNDPHADWGADLKYGLGRNLTANFTYNTDFAQVEADEQQINLTRFNLFFPEKRDFFLENSQTFTFGGTGNDNTPALFYSRRVGLNQARVVPIQAGGRLTGRMSRYSLGVLNIRTDDEPVSGGAPATWFSVFRLKRDVLRRSNIGAMLTSRSIGQLNAAANQAYGVDGTFAFFNNLYIDTYWARTNTTSLVGNDTSYRGQIDYQGDRYAATLERLQVGVNFNPEMGFVRHPDLRRSFGKLQFSPRPKGRRIVRKLFYTATMEYGETGAGRVDTRASTGEFAIDFQNSDHLSVKYFDTYEFLPATLVLAPGVPGASVARGGYEYRTIHGGYNFGTQRKLASANVAWDYGTFYDGHKTTVGISRGRLNFPPHLSVEPGYSINSVSLPGGSFVTHLATSRVK